MSEVKLRDMHLVEFSLECRNVWVCFVEYLYYSR